MAIRGFICYNADSAKFKGDYLHKGRKQGYNETKGILLE